MRAGRYWTEQQDLNLKIEQRLRAREDVRNQVRHTQSSLGRTEQLIKTYAMMRDLKP